MKFGYVLVAMAKPLEDRGGGGREFLKKINLFFGIILNNLKIFK